MSGPAVRRLRIAMIGFWFAVSGCAVCGSEHDGFNAVARERAISVATYNVNYGMPGDPETIAALLAADADIALLQETNHGWEQALRRELEWRYPHQIYVEPTGYPAGGIAILSGYALFDVGSSESAVGWFPSLRAKVRSERGVVQLVNVHLKPPVSASGSVALGYFSTPAERESEMRRHLQDVDLTIPTIIAGDFNEECGGALGMLEELGFVGALGIDDRFATTWRDAWTPFGLSMRLDHVLARPADFQGAEARVVQQGRSDHFPVVAWLEPAKP